MTLGSWKQTSVWHQGARCVAANVNSIGTLHRLGIQWMARDVYVVVMVQEHRLAEPDTSQSLAENLAKLGWASTCAPAAHTETSTSREQPFYGAQGYRCGLQSFKRMSLGQLG